MWTPLTNFMDFSINSIVFCSYDRNSHRCENQTGSVKETTVEGRAACLLVE